MLLINYKKKTRACARTHTQTNKQTNTRTSLAKELGLCRGLCTWQHTALRTDNHSSPQRDSNLARGGHRPTP